MELKVSCSSCKYAKLKERWHVVDSKGKFLYEDKNNPNSEDTMFVCLLNDEDVERKHVCSKYELHTNYKGNRIEYCPECDADTYSKEWFCSRCWCDRDDSELFED